MNEALIPAGDARIRSRQATARIAGRPIHAMIVPFPVACFFGTFVTDIVYWQTKSIMWETMSVWLLTVGLVISAFAVLAGLVDFAGSRGIRSLWQVWFHGIGNAIALILSIVNVFVHSRDGYTAVVPEGLILSGSVVLILLVTGWVGASIVYRHRVGVTNLGVSP